ncbi:transketolase family protein [Terrimonas alba]|uniref:transketolase family protein n=1 Tax=Terrimonas alba TaxID=3349636 RepID=UPI0035F33198
MRKEFAEAVIEFVGKNDKMVFLTGDLGYMALENVRDKLGQKFINAGVAEQNMVTMAAALAYEGFTPLIYSISPFITLRPYEQLRNDVCLHNLPVKIIANGGGYGYGIMGSTHHNIEDIGSMRILPNMKVYVPFTKNDVGEALREMLQDPSPNYLRLNLASNQGGVPSFSPWRKIKSVDRFPSAVVIGTGTVTDNLFKLPAHLLDELEIWLVSRFPVYDLPKELLHQAREAATIITIEEHQGQCGLHETLASLFLKNLKTPVAYHTLFASGYPSGKYGSQQWHLEENNLAGKNLEAKIEEFISIVPHVN